MFYIKGYLVAWAVHIFEFWLKNLKILKDSVYQSLAAVCDGYQLRIIMGWADLITVYIMVRVHLNKVVILVKCWQDVINWMP